MVLFGYAILALVSVGTVLCIVVGMLNSDASKNRDDDSTALDAHNRSSVPFTRAKVEATTPPEFMNPNDPKNIRLPMCNKGRR